MKLEELEKLKKKDLRSRINECFKAAEETGSDSNALYTKAEFYMRELEHRRDSFVSGRDLLLEVIVIAMIGWEILMGYRQEHNQSTDFTKEQAILQHLESSSQSTADTLSALKGTTETMSGAIQKEVGLFYDVEINIVYDDNQKALNLINNGRTNAFLWGMKFADAKSDMKKEAEIIPPTGSFFIGMENTAKLYETTLAKGTYKDIPLVFYFMNERKERFTIYAPLTAIWKNNAISFNCHVTEIRPGWDGK